MGRFCGLRMSIFFQAGLPKELQLELLEIYLVLKNIPAPYTFFKNVYKILPGHFLLAGENGIHVDPYWQFPEIDEDNPSRDEVHVLSEFESLLRDSVKIRMRSDVPFGAFLSGGLDSSSVVALMSDISAMPVKTFTIGYHQKDFDESPMARIVADRFGTEHYTGFVEPEKFDQILDHNVFHFDEPFGDSSAIPTGYVSRFAAEKVKMVLTGDGGDEVLSGYPSYQGLKFIERYLRIAKPVRLLTPFVINLMLKLSFGNIRYTLNRLNNFVESAEEDFNHRMIIKRAKPDLTQIKMLTKHLKGIIPIEDYITDRMNCCGYKDDFYRMMYLNFMHDLPNDYLVKVDRMSMAYSLETRVPFLDHRLVEFMVKVDKNIKMKGYDRKSVLKESVGKMLPPSLLLYPKRGFLVPIREWFKDQEFQSRSLEFSAIEGILDFASVKKIFKDNYEGREDNGNLIWSLLVLKKVIQKSST